MSDSAVLLENVYKYYNKTPVVNALSFQVQKGEMFGLLGPNGAGKSTTIRMLTTLTIPSEGKIEVSGFDVGRQSQQVKRSIGVVLQQTSVDGDLTVWENMEYHARLHQMPAAIQRQAIGQYLEYVELTDRADAMVKTLSGGMKRRLQIARALLHQPEVLFLDEPTVGLDPQTRRRLWEIIQQLKDRGMTILLTTHYMEEAEFLCDRIGIMDAGKLIEQGTPDQLRRKHGEAVVITQQEQDGKLDFQFFPDLDQANAHVDQHRDRTGMMVRASNLEDIFVELTGRKLD
ncbi:Sulfate-transporting ATPase [Thalassoporum mexicanum PCC 7367]|uniref:heme ABC exporter ATP-binding protein CcmA n=1 Tax=Thalassoporum mexicanum TaxID=3457544 RepID=UPI00029FE30C|nr:heme ABC exporter ATP-binding protein CcmA [Pseudanabaena sp. PCC 7367]AFY70241.1 Sulfate-transporting ATPase [Pseudanabaena sp. PCC 7367]